VSDENELLEAAKESVRSNFKALEQIFDGRLEDFAELEAHDMVIFASDDVVAVQRSETSVYYEVSEDAALWFLGNCSDRRDVYDAALKICMSNIFEGEPLPYSFRRFAHSVLGGRMDVPKRRQPLGKQIVLKCLLYWSATYLQYEFPVKNTRNDASFEKVSGSRVVSEVAKEFGVNYQESTIRDWCSHKDSIKFREYAEDLELFLNTKSYRDMFSKS